MSKVFVNIGLSLDGYIAPEGMTMDDPEHRNWGAKWGALMAWIINQQYFRENLKLGPGGETGAVNDLVRSTTERIGANVMGKRMFDQGEVAWPYGSWSPGIAGSSMATTVGLWIFGWPPPTWSSFWTCRPGWPCRESFEDGPHTEAKFGPAWPLAAGNGLAGSS